MPRVVWSSEAVRILATLPLPVQVDIVLRSRMLTEFPEMYPVRRRGRFRGQRVFIAFEWLVYYVIQGGLVAVTTIRPARRKDV